jgi:undecaprenyl-diphosphatase
MVFGLTAYFASQSVLFPSDDAIAGWITSFRADWWQDFMRGLSFLGEWPVAPIMVLVTFLVLLIKKQHRLGLLFLATPAVAEITLRLSKLLVDRPRPGTDPIEGGMSFPSGHASFLLIFFGLVIFFVSYLVPNLVLFRLIQILMFAIIILGGVSRIYLGAHWPSDVIGGYLHGLMWLLPAVLLNNMYVSNKVKEKVSA